MTLGDGNCLFNAISYALFGSEMHQLEIRVRVLCELIINEKRYLNNHALSVMSDSKLRNVDIVQYILLTSASESDFDGSRTNYYRKEVLNSFKNYRECGMLHLYATTNILERTVYTVYPHISNSGIRRDIHNQKLLPLTHKIKLEPIYIMWSYLGRKDGELPNHFVSLHVSSISSSGTSTSKSLSENTNKPNKPLDQCQKRKRKLQKCDIYHFFKPKKDDNESRIHDGDTHKFHNQNKSPLDLCGDNENKRLSSYASNDKDENSILTAPATGIKDTESNLPTVQLNCHNNQAKSSNSTETHVNDDIESNFSEEKTLKSPETRFNDENMNEIDSNLPTVDPSCHKDEKKSSKSPETHVNDESACFHNLSSDNSVGSFHDTNSPSPVNCAKQSHSSNDCYTDETGEDDFEDMPTLDTECKKQNRKRKGSCKECPKMKRRKRHSVSCFHKEWSLKWNCIQPVKNNKLKAFCTVS